MTEQEKKDRIALLEKKKKGFEQNRTISVVVLGLIGYDTWKSFNESAPVWYFFLIMGLLMAAVTAIIIRDSIQIKKIEDAVKKTQSEESEN